jgi:hypothetical protein
MGRTALKARLTLEAQRPFIQPQPGKRPCPSLRRTPRRAAAQPARRHRRWQRPWLALGCSSARASSFSPLQGKHKARRPAALGRRHARDAARRACALASAGGEAVAMARVGAAGQPSRSPAPATKAHGTKAGSQHDNARHHGGSPRDGAASMGFPVHRAGRLSHEHRQQRVGTARSWRWGAPAPPPSPPCCANQNGTMAKTSNLRRNARSAQGSTARRGDVLSSPSKTARAPALTSSPGARGLG